MLMYVVGYFMAGLLHMMIYIGSIDEELMEIDNPIEGIGYILILTVLWPYYFWETVYNIWKDLRKWLNTL